MKANASDYYKWPEESSIISGTCRAGICYNGKEPLFTEIVVTNKKIILKNQQSVDIIYLSSVESLILDNEQSIINIELPCRYNHRVQIKINNNAAWADTLFEAINDAVSKIK